MSFDTCYSVPSDTLRLATHLTYEPRSQPPIYLPPTSIYHTHSHPIGLTLPSFFRAASIAGRSDEIRQYSGEEETRVSADVGVVRRLESELKRDVAIY